MSLLPPTTVPIQAMIVKHESRIRSLESKNRDLEVALAGSDIGGVGVGGGGGGGNAGKSG